MTKNELTIIMGKSLAGKTYFINKIKQENPAKVLITSTTRPKRPYEKDKKDYYFETDKACQLAIKNHNALALRSYEVANGDTWYYYIDKKHLFSQLKKQSHMYSVLDLNGYCKLEKEKIKDVKITGLYLNVPLKVRLKRYLKTERKNDNEKEFVRRLYDDEFNAFNAINNKKFDKTNHITILPLENISKAVEDINKND